MGEAERPRTHGGAQLSVGEGWGTGDTLNGLPELDLQNPLCPLAAQHMRLHHVKT